MQQTLWNSEGNCSFYPSSWPASADVRDNFRTYSRNSFLPIFIHNIDVSCAPSFPLGLLTKRGALGGCSTALQLLYFYHIPTLPTEFLAQWLFLILPSNLTASPFSASSHRPSELMQNVWVEVLLFPGNKELLKRHILIQVRAKHANNMFVRARALFAAVVLLFSSFFLSQQWWMFLISLLLRLSYFILTLFISAVTETN